MPLEGNGGQRQRVGDEGKAVGCVTLTALLCAACALVFFHMDLLEVPNLPRGFHTKRSQMEWTLLVGSFKCVRVC
jgi:hypothetical protein